METSTTARQANISVRSPGKCEDCTEWDQCAACSYYQDLVYCEEALAERDDELATARQALQLRNTARDRQFMNETRRRRQWRTVAVTTLALLVVTNAAESITFWASVLERIN